MQEANVYGYWEEMTSFLRNLFHATFKTNKYCIDGLQIEIDRTEGEECFLSKGQEDGD